MGFNPVFFFVFSSEVSEETGCSLGEFPSLCMISRAPTPLFLEISSSFPPKETSLHVNFREDLHVCSGKFPMSRTISALQPQFFFLFSSSHTKKLNTSCQFLQRSGTRWGNPTPEWQIYTGRFQNDWTTLRASTAFFSSLFQLSSKETQRSMSILQEIGHSLGNSTLYASLLRGSLTRYRFV